MRRTPPPIMRSSTSTVVATTTFRRSQCVIRQRPSPDGSAEAINGPADGASGSSDRARTSTRHPGRPSAAPRRYSRQKWAVSSENDPRPSDQACH
jgi:hypothetical protein